MAAVAPSADAEEFVEEAAKKVAEWTTKEEIKEAVEEIEGETS